MDNNLKKVKVFAIVLFLSALCFLSSAFCYTAYAAVPHLINYQGRLTDASGAPLNSSPNITFRIYDAESAGSLLWQGTYNNVPVTKGIFNILLGDINDSGYNFQSLAFDKPYWLEIKVDTDNPMTPRQRITSTAYAIRAERLVDEPLPTARGGTGSTANANTANGVVILNTAGKYPALDGSLITGITSYVNTRFKTGIMTFTFSNESSKAVTVSRIGFTSVLLNFEYKWADANNIHTVSCSYDGTTHYSVYCSQNSYGSGQGIGPSNYFYLPTIGSSLSTAHFRGVVSNITSDAFTVTLTAYDIYNIGTNYTGTIYLLYTAFR